MSQSLDALHSILRSGDVQRVVDFFAGMPEAERHTYAALAWDWCELLELNSHARFRPRAAQEVAKRETIAEPYPLFAAAHAALLACGSLAQIKALPFTHASDETIVQIFADRRPAWLDQYVGFLCGGEPSRVTGIHWRRIRALVRAGLCRPPEHDNYALGALEGIQVVYNHEETCRRREQGLPPVPVTPRSELLLAERDWLETAFWRLFELEGNGDVSLANAEKYTGRWIEPLVELAQRGVLSRERLLDASLSALSRDFIQFRAGWFSRFHEALAPTAEERVARVETYLTLLASSIPPTVAMAIDAVALADQARPLPASKLLPALQPVLGARGKAVVKTALRLLDRVAVREPPARGEVCVAAVAALLHEATDVQKAVFALLKRHGDKSDAPLRARLTEVSSAVAASLRAERDAWLDPAGRTKTPAAPRPVERPAFVAPERTALRVEALRAVVPIASLDDLLHAAAVVLERPDNPDELERVLDGVSRLCGERPADFVRRVGPLQAQALGVLRRIPMSPARLPLVERWLAMVLLSWLAGADVFQHESPAFGEEAGYVRFLHRRVAALGRRVAAAQALPLLSAPTRVGGWLEAGVLVERWLTWQEAQVTPPLHEQVLALLRLAPGDRASALPAAEGLQGEAGDAVRCALGREVPTGPTAPLWLAAWRSRQPFGDLPDFERVHPHLGPDAGAGAQMTWQTSKGGGAEGKAFVFAGVEVQTAPSYPANVDDALLPVLFHRRSQQEFFEPTSRELLRWAGQLWPANREGFFASGITRLLMATGWADVRDRETGGFFGTLAEPQAELGPMGCLALALGLAAQDVALRGEAQEDLIALIANGRLDADALGDAMARLLKTGNAKFDRWAKSLREVVRVSPLHVEATADLLQRALRGDPTGDRALAPLLELLVELLSETNTTLSHAPARDYLARIRGSSKRAQLAKQLLQM